jgi:hypothetical protein
LWYCKHGDTFLSKEDGDNPCGVANTVITFLSKRGYGEMPFSATSVLFPPESERECRGDTDMGGGGKQHSESPCNATSAAQPHLKIIGAHMKKQLFGRGSLWLV